MVFLISDNIQISQLLYAFQICKRYSFKCDMVEYSTRPMG